jgi:hypothetical protein
LADSPERFIVLRFPGCTFLNFGGPGHNGRHRLASSGLGLYGVYEVLNSSLYDDYYHLGPDQAHLRSGAPGRSRHFVITFHDDTFECSAKDMVGEFTSEPGGAFGPGEPAPGPLSNRGPTARAGPAPDVASHTFDCLSGGRGLAATVRTDALSERGTYLMLQVTGVPSTWLAWTVTTGGDARQVMGRPSLTMRGLLALTQ